MQIQISWLLQKAGYIQVQQDKGKKESVESKFDNEKISTVSEFSGPWCQEVNNNFDRNDEKWVQFLNSLASNAKKSLINLTRTKKEWVQFLNAAHDAKKSIYHSRPNYHKCSLSAVKQFSRGGWVWRRLVYLVSPGRPTEIGLQLGKACYPCSR